ncbi:Rieske (2Fe-2S) protein [Aequoribacter sp.]|uniref:Rieske (2Fe-2S) protein n=1 Tax=Aequoribacter sp. TaxID=2847771 RepID=UPI003F69FC8A
MRFIPLERLINLHEGYRQAFKIEGADIILLHEDGQTYAFSRTCPHQNYALDYAKISDGLLLCSAHGFEFDLKRSGVLVKPAGFPCPALKTYDLVYDADRIGLML